MAQTAIGPTGAPSCPRTSCVWRRRRSSSPSCSVGSTPRTRLPSRSSTWVGAAVSTTFPPAPPPGPAPGGGGPRPRCAAPARGWTRATRPGRGVRARPPTSASTWPCASTCRARGRTGSVSRGDPVAAGTGRLLLRGHPQPVALLRPGQRRRGSARHRGLGAAPAPTGRADRGVPLTGALPLQHHPPSAAPPRSTPASATAEFRVLEQAGMFETYFPPRLRWAPRELLPCRSTVGPPGAVRHLAVPAGDLRGPGDGRPMGW